MRYLMHILKRCHTQGVQNAAQYHAGAPAAASRGDNLHNYANVHTYSAADFLQDYSDIFSEEALP